MDRFQLPAGTRLRLVSKRTEIFDRVAEEVVEVHDAIHHVGRRPIWHDNETNRFPFFERYHELVSQSLISLNALPDIPTVIGWKSPDLRAPFAKCHAGHCIKLR